MGWTYSACNDQENDIDCNILFGSGCFHLNWLYDINVDYCQRYNKFGGFISSIIDKGNGTHHPVGNDQNIIQGGCLFGGWKEQHLKG